METKSDIIPAATVILFRERAEQVPELLMLKRSEAMVFAAGALVFPGGRIDPHDYDLAERFLGDLDHDDAAARIASIRETIEEAGIAIGFADTPEHGQVHAMREALISGASFGTLLDEHRLSLSLEPLAPFSRWCPPGHRVRRFDTRFYVARVPEAAIANADGFENTKVLWDSASGILDRCHAGEYHAIFPTYCTLQRLAQYGSHADAVRDTEVFPPVLVTPYIENRDGQNYMCIPEGIGYPTISILAGAIKRG
jgi:8-oxo-dGTP pyrophosphatase MutT (NUDIX family)